MGTPTAVSNGGRVLPSTGQLQPAIAGLQRGGSTYRRLVWRKELPPFDPAVASMGRGPIILPPVHPAVTSYRQTNRRQGDIFEKKYSHIYF